MHVPGYNPMLDLPALSEGLSAATQNHADHVGGLFYDDKKTPRAHSPMATAWHYHSWQYGSLLCALRAALRTLERILQQVGIPLPNLWQIDLGGSRTKSPPTS